MGLYTSSTTVSSGNCSSRVIPSFVSSERQAGGAISREQAVEMGHRERVANGEPKALATGVPASLIYTQNHSTPPPQKHPFFVVLNVFLSSL